MLRAYATSTASVERLWDVVSDVTAWPRHLTTFRSVVPSGPQPGLGARFRVEQPGLAPATYEVTDWQAGRSFTWVAPSRGIVTTATHTVSEAGTGSRLELHLTWSGPLAPAVRLLLGRRTRRMIEREATTLATVAEAP